MDRGTVLVTGGAGFAGAYVTRELLDRGYGVVVYDVGEFGPSLGSWSGMPSVASSSNGARLITCRVSSKS